MRLEREEGLTAYVDAAIGLGRESDAAPVIARLRRTLWTEAAEAQFGEVVGKKRKKAFKRIVVGSQAGELKDSPVMRIQ